MKDATEILDGIVRSIERVGRSGRDDVYLDNVSFRINSETLDIPHDSSLRDAESKVEEIWKKIGRRDFEPEVGFFSVETDLLSPNVSFIQILPIDYRSEGRKVNMMVTMPCVDAVRELPQEVLTLELFLHYVSSYMGLKPGHITFNIGVAFINWEDVTCEVGDLDELEIPR